MDPPFTKNSSYLEVRHMKFGVVIFPSKKLQDLANSYRKRYDPHYSLITPHLTLKGFEATKRK